MNQTCEQLPLVTSFSLKDDVPFWQIAIVYQQQNYRCPLSSIQTYLTSLPSSFAAITNSEIQSTFQTFYTQTHQISAWMQQQGHFIQRQIIKWTQTIDALNSLFKNHFQRPVMFKRTYWNNELRPPWELFSPPQSSSNPFYIFCWDPWNQIHWRNA